MSHANFRDFGKIMVVSCVHAIWNIVLTFDPHCFSVSLNHGIHQDRIRNCHLASIVLDLCTH